MEHHSSLSHFSVLFLLCVLFGISPVLADQHALSNQSEDELKAGMFSSVHGQMVYVCFYGEISLWDSAVYVPAEGGCGKHRMKVLRYGYDADGKQYILDTLRLNRPEDNFDSWLLGYTLRTDTAGVFALKTFVRDEGCAEDWVPNEGEFKYTVRPRFFAGSIPDGNDTLYMKNGRVTVSITALTPASGGDGVYSYKWKKFENDIPKATSEDLVNHVVKADEFKLPKTIKFKRWAMDASRCGRAQSTGVYKVTVFEEFNPGEIEEKPDLAFCTLDKAKQHIVTATPATGGSLSYLYQWFIQEGSTLTPIEGATDCNLPMSKVNLVEGKDYTFVRKVKDDTRFTEWTLSGKQQELSLTARPEVKIAEAEACACNGEITLYYELISGEVDIYKVQFSPSLEAKIGKPQIIAYIGEPRIPGTVIIPDLPELPEGDYYMDVQLGISCSAKSLEEVDCYSLPERVKVVNGLDDVVSQKFERILVVDNNPARFNGYQWYKNGQPVSGATKQYYQDQSSDMLNGSYFARLQGKDGKSYRSCSIHQLGDDNDPDESQAPERIIYPTQAKAGQPVMIQGDEAMMTIYSCTGELIQMTTIGQRATIAAPAAEGLYFVQLRYADGSLLTEKLIVK